MKTIIKKYDGHVSTRTVGGELIAVHLLSTNVTRGENRPRTGPKLTGFGTNVHMAALDLIAQLRLYADWIAHEHDQPILDLATLKEQIQLRTGLPMEVKVK